MSDWSPHLASLRTLLHDQLGVRGRTLGQQVRRAGRRLPRALRTDALFLARAEEMARHPRLARLVDPRQVAKAEGRVASHLRSLDPVQARRHRRLDWLATAGFYILSTAALIVAVLWWRGFI
ncbi:hypothetical protein [Rubellimicrobium arenae]|uniref:hypothetical protein n=1 Tax=Rubellimicrobium arenae TaxID=2817372 RepID=UPI001B30AA68|nr:hypothetical protein [Rubellimicrobium arenae]